LNKPKFRSEAYSYLKEFRCEALKRTGRKLTDEELVKVSIATNRASCELNLMWAEIAWGVKRKPFFNVHEPIVRSIKNTSLKIKPESIPRSVVHDLGVLCIKFPIGLNQPELNGIEHFFICMGQKTFYAKTGQIMPGGSIGFSYQNKVSTFGFTWMLSQCFDDAESMLEKKDETATEFKTRLLIARIGIGIMLLAANPDFIKPILLKCDQGRSVDLETLKKRAHQRGLIGYEIGADMEVSPHFRRPHFAIRWTGKGSEVPKLVPVKGAIIHKSKMQEIPTGYEIPE